MACARGGAVVPKFGRTLVPKPQRSLRDVAEGDATSPQVPLACDPLGRRPRAEAATRGARAGAYGACHRRCGAALGRETMRTRPVPKPVLWRRCRLLDLLPTAHLRSGRRAVPEAMHVRFSQRAVPTPTPAQPRICRSPSCRSRRAPELHTRQKAHPTKGAGPRFNLQPRSMAGAALMRVRSDHRAGCEVSEIGSCPKERS